MNTNFVAVGVLARFTFPPEPASWLNVCGMAHMAVLIGSGPVVEVDQLGLPASLHYWPLWQGGRMTSLPAQRISDQQRREVGKHEPDYFVIGVVWMRRYAHAMLQVASRLVIFGVRIKWAKKTLIVIFVFISPGRQTWISHLYWRLFNDCRLAIFVSHISLHFMLNVLSLVFVRKVLFQLSFYDID